MLDFIRSNSIIHPDISSWISDIQLNSLTYYSELYICELKLALEKKYNTIQSKKTVFIDNGSSSILHKIIQNYNNFYIQNQDFYLYEELINFYKKDYKRIKNDNFLDTIMTINHSCILIFTLINNITGEDFSIDTLIDLAQKKRNVQFVIDGAYKEYSKLTDYDIYKLSCESNIHYIGTFSKAYGIPGFRIGYMLSDILLEIPYSISSISAYSEVESLQNKIHINNLKYIIKEHKPCISQINNTEITNHKINLQHEKVKKIKKKLKANFMLP